MARTYNRKTKRYPNELKAKAVQLSQLTGVEVQDVAKTLDIHPFMLSRWRKEYREGKLKVKKPSKSESLHMKEKEVKANEALRKENVGLKKENLFLKKWQRFLGERRKSAIRSSRETVKNFR